MVEESFFRMDVIMACLKETRKILSDRHLFTNVVIKGHRSPENSFTNQVGIGSKVEVLVDKSATSSVLSSWDTGVKSLRMHSTGQGKIIG